MPVLRLNTTSVAVNGIDILKKEGECYREDIACDLKTSPSGWVLTLGNSSQCPSKVVLQDAFLGSIRKILMEELPAKFIKDEEFCAQREHVCFQIPRGLSGISA